MVLARMRPPGSTALLADPDLGHRLARARRARGLSQVALAHEVGVGRRAVQAWEAGTSGISTEKLARLEEVLGVSRTELSGVEPLPAREEEELAARLARLELKMDALLQALGVEVQQAQGGQLIAPSEAVLDRLVERMAEGFAGTLGVLRQARPPGDGGA